MSNPCKCGSFAINPHLHGRDNTDLYLCDVCYWRKRGEQLEAKDNEIDILRQLVSIREAETEKVELAYETDMARKDAEIAEWERRYETLGETYAEHRD